jgi:hypothetical protein
MPLRGEGSGSLLVTVPYAHESAQAPGPAFAAERHKNVASGVSPWNRDGP